MLVSLNILSNLSIPDKRKVKKKEKKRENYTVTALDIFQTSLTSLRWRRWCMETCHIITVTGQIHGHPYYYQSCTSKHPVPFPT